LRQKHKKIYNETETQQTGQRWQMRTGREIETERDKHRKEDKGREEEEEEKRKKMRRRERKGGGWEPANARKGVLGLHQWSLDFWGKFCF